MCLISGAVHAVAEYGLENVTTKKISDCAQVNEALIFRYYKSKDDFLLKAFLEVGAEIAQEMLSAAPLVLQHPEQEPETRMRAFFARIWSFFLDHPDMCVFSLRYYHSEAYKKHIEQGFVHESALTERLKAYFPHSENTNLMLLYSLVNLFCAVEKVWQGVLPRTRETEERVFRLLYDGLWYRFAEKLEVKESIRHRMRFRPEHREKSSD